MCRVIGSESFKAVVRFWIPIVWCRLPLVLLLDSLFATWFFYLFIYAIDSSTYDVGCIAYIHILWLGS